MTKAKKNVTDQELMEKIESQGGSYELVYHDELVKRDLDQVNFDFENMDPISDYSLPGIYNMEDCEKISDFPVAWMAAGGDWENPLVFCFYIGEDDKLHGYVPSDGNAYDHKHNCAWGSAPEEDDRYFFEHEKELYKFDAQKLRDDVVNALS